MCKSAKGGWLITSLLIFSLQRTACITRLLGQLRTGLWLAAERLPAHLLVNPSLATSSRARGRGDIAVCAATGSHLPLALP